MSAACNIDRMLTIRPIFALFMNRADRFRLRADDRRRCFGHRHRRSGADHSRREEGQVREEWLHWWNNKIDEEGNRSSSYIGYNKVCTELCKN